MATFSQEAGGELGRRSAVGQDARIGHVIGVGNSLAHTDSGEPELAPSSAILPLTLLLTFSAPAPRAALWSTGPSRTAPLRAEPTLRA